MADVTTSRQKAEYISHDIIIRGKAEFVQLKYKRLDGDNPGAEQITGAFVSKLDKESRDRIKAGGTFVVVKTKEGDYWNLTKVDDMSTYTAKTTNTYNGGGQKSYPSKGSASTYNTAGIKVGAVLHDAVALAGVGATISKVKTLAEELLNLSYELEANVNAGKYEPKAEKTTTAKTTTTKVTTEVETSEALDNIDF
jgi:hypothetical protein